MLRRLLPPTRCARGSGIFLFHTRGLRPGLLICRPDGLKKIRGRNDRLSQLFTLQSPIYRDEGGFFQNVADVSIVYQIFGTHVKTSVKEGYPLDFPNLD